MDYFLLILAFGVFSGLTYSGFLVVANRRQRLAQRLQREDLDEEPAALVLGDMTPALAGQVPMGQEGKSELQRELRAAGFYRPTALMEYTAVRAVLIILPLLAAGIGALLVTTWMQALYVWIGGGVAAGLGFSLPRIYLYFRARRRMHVIERGLPTAIDMLTLSLGAGLNVLNSLQRVAQEVRRAFPVLGEELEIVRRQAELRTLEFALVQFADRVGLPQIRNLSVILSQSENLGTDAVHILREYADNMRVGMRQRADELANKAPFQLLFPAYLLAIGAGILLVAPTVLEFNAFRRSALITNSINQAKQNMKEYDLVKKEVTPGD